MPMPVSVTESSINRPGLAQECFLQYWESIRTLIVSMVRTPPLGIASLALTQRFITTCSSMPLSPFTAPTALPGTHSRRMCSPMSLRTILRMSSTIRLKSRTSMAITCLRLNSSSCLVSSAALPAPSRTPSIPERTSSEVSSSFSIWA